jgi:hypothetical protein
MPNYQNGKIYQIWSPQTDQVYIGSTIQSLCKRMVEHRCQHLTSHKILQYDDAKIELIECFPCDNKMELNKREGEIMRGYNYEKLQ